MLCSPVCIIGAGPAGTISSLFLSHHKVPHILVEREAFPREKVCGEFYDGRLIRVLDRIDPTLLPRMKAAKVVQDIRRYSYISTQLRTFQVDIAPQSLARISTNRREFDTFLLDEARKSPYVQYFDPINISESHYTEGGIVLTDVQKQWAVKAEAAIVATGCNSTLAQKLVPQNRSVGHFILAARGYYRNVIRMGGQESVQIFFLRKNFPYYLYLVHLPNNLTTVEIGILKKVATKYRCTPTDLLSDAIATHPTLRTLFADAHLEGKIKGAVLPETTLNAPMSAERVLLAGSSGSSINPVTGWGVGHAAFEGMCAVQHYLAAAEKGDFSAAFLKNYDTHVQKSLSRERMVGYAADFAFKYGHRSLNWGLGLLEKTPWLSRKVGQMINSL